MQIYYEVGIDTNNEGTITIADFESKVDAINFIDEYNLKQPSAKLFIDTITFDFLTNNL